MALGLSVQLPGQRIPRILAAQDTQQQDHILFPKCGQGHFFQHAQPGQLVPKCGQGMPGVDARRAVGASQKQRLVARLPSQVVDQLQGRGVGPLQVVEHQDQGLPFSAAADHLRQGGQQPRALLVGRQRLVGWQVEAQPAQLGQQFRHGRQLAGRTRRRSGCKRGQQAAQRFDDGGIGSVLLQFVALAGQDVRPPRRRQARQLLQQAGLADPRLARHEDDAALPLHRPPQEIGQQRPLTVAPHERQVQGQRSGQRGRGWLGEQRRCAQYPFVQCRGLRQGVHAQFAGEHSPAARKGPQRPVLLAGAIVRLHHQPPGALAARVPAQHAPGVGQRLALAAQGQVAGRQGDLHVQECLAQPLPRRQGPLLVGVLGQVVAPVERFRRLEGLDGRRPSPLSLARLPLPDMVQEAVHVDLATLPGVETVAGCLGDDKTRRAPSAGTRLQQPPQPTDRHPQAVARRFGVQIRPQPLQQLVAGHHPLPVRDQDLEQLARLPAGPGLGGHHLPVEPDRKGPQQMDTQAVDHSLLLVRSGWIAKSSPSLFQSASHP